MFPGGCFFAAAAAELDTRPGRVRDRVVATLRDWVGLFEEAVATARERGEIDGQRPIGPSSTFEVNAMLAEANGLYVLNGDPRYIAMARRAIADRLERAAP